MKTSVRTAGKIIAGLVLAASLAPFASAQSAASAPPAAQAQRRQFNGVFGSIQSITGNQLMLKAPDGTDIAVTLNDKTNYSKDHQPAKVTDFHIGDTVVVRGQKAGDASWTAETVMARPKAGGGMSAGLGKEFIAGEIKVIDGTKLTILRPDGQTQVIQVTEDTSFKKNAQNITFPDLKVGDHIFGRGALKDGVFVPQSLNTGNPRPNTAVSQPAPGPQ
jgi:hypothetical protein